MRGGNKQFRLSLVAAAVAATSMMPLPSGSVYAATSDAGGVSNYSTPDAMYKSGNTFQLEAGESYQRRTAVDFTYSSGELPAGITSIYVENNSMTAPSGATVENLYTVYGSATGVKGFNNTNTLDICGATVTQYAANVYAENADAISFTNNKTTLHDGANVVNLASLAGSSTNTLFYFGNTLAVDNSTVSNISSLYMSGTTASVGKAGEGNTVTVSDATWNLNNPAEDLSISTLFGSYLKLTGAATVDSNSFTLNDVKADNAEKGGEIIHVQASLGAASTIQNNTTAINGGNFNAQGLILAGVHATASTGSITLANNTMTASPVINAQELYMLGTWAVSGDPIFTSGSSLDIDGSTITATNLGVVIAARSVSPQAGQISSNSLSINNSTITLPSAGEGLGYVAAAMDQGNVGQDVAYVSMSNTLSIVNSTVSADIVAAAYSESSTTAQMNNMMVLENANITAPSGVYAAVTGNSADGYVGTTSMPNYLNIAGVNTVNGSVGGFNIVNAVLKPENADKYVLTTNKAIDLSNASVNISSTEDLTASKYGVIQAPTIKLDNTQLTIETQYLKTWYFVNHGAISDYVTGLWIQRLEASGSVSRDPETKITDESGKTTRIKTTTDTGDDSGSASGSSSTTGTTGSGDTGSTTGSTSGSGSATGTTGSGDTGSTTGSTSGSGSATGTTGSGDTGSTTGGTSGSGSTTGTTGSGDTGAESTSGKDTGDASGTKPSDTGATTGVTKHVTVTGSDGTEKHVSVTSSTDGTQHTITDSDGKKHTATVTTDSDGTKHVVIKDASGNTEKTVKVSTDSDGTKHITVNDASGKTVKNISVNDNGDGTKTAKVTDESGKTKTVTVDNSSTTESVPLSSIPGVTHGTEAKESTKMLADATLGAAVSVTESAGFLADDGMDAILNSIRLGKNLFGVARVGDSSYKAHERVSVVNSMFVMGVTHKVQNTTLAAFIDGGLGRAKTHWSDFSGRANFSSYGIGVAGRCDFEKPFYLEGLVRIGQLHSRYSAVVDNQSSHYRTSNFYVSGHVGAGYVFKLTDTNSLDLYTKYLVTHLGADTTDISGSSKASLHISSTTSQASRTGVRMRTAWTKTLETTVGAAYQRTFNGKVKTSIEGINLDVPMFKGNTGIGEVGVKYSPSEMSPWNINLNLKGYVGERTGASATAVINYRF